MCELTTTRYNERMVDDILEEYIRKFLDDAPYEWEENSKRKTTKIQDVAIVYNFGEDRVTPQGNPVKARAMLQMMQCRQEVEEEKQEKLQIHKRKRNRATQTEE